MSLDLWSRTEGELPDLLRRSSLAAKALGGCSRAVVDSLQRRFPHRHERLLDPFRSDGAPGMAAYEDLVRYFIEGWATYKLASVSGARYPGLGSWSGRRVDELEAFARSAPLWGAWVHGGRPAVVERPGGGNTDLIECFTDGIKAGTTPDRAGYWGRMHGRSDQRVVEAADVALALWLFGDRAWDRLSGAERDRLMEWLALAHELPGLENNWHLFFILIDRVQRSFGYPGADEVVSQDRFTRIQSFHIRDGWFRDGPDGRADYYNAWGFHYLLQWIQRIDPTWAPDYIPLRLAEFVAGYRYVMGPRGFPILGRSIPYRLAAPAPMLFAQSVVPEIVSPAEARRSLDATWCHFIRHGAVRRGTVTQGYYQTDHRLLDNYSGPASSLWSLRSLVAAFADGRDAPLWRSVPATLPVEREDYRVHLQAPGWTVTGDTATHRITIDVDGVEVGAKPPLQPYRLAERVRAAAHGRPRRPNNHEAKYERSRYSSSGPDCLVDMESPPRWDALAAHLFPY